MTDHFIYVFSKDDRDELLAQGFQLLRSNDRSEVYIFRNDMEHKFALEAGRFILTDTLVF